MTLRIELKKGQRATFFGANLFSPLIFKHLSHRTRDKGYYRYLEIDNECRFKTKLYDKRDDLSFSIENFPFLCSNIPEAPAYGVYISQLIRYSRACISYHNFIDRGLLLTRKLLNQEFQMVKFKSSFRKFYGRHHELVDCYGITVSQMVLDTS